jgi:hypothetical protein
LPLTISEWNKYGPFAPGISGHVLARPSPEYPLCPFFNWRNWLDPHRDLFVPGVFDNLIRNTGSTLWYTTEFGAALAIVSAVFAMYFWTRRTEIRDISFFWGDVQTESPR